MPADRVFISYRRQPGGGHAGRLFDSLARRLGRKRVFFDESAIEPGTDFRTRLKAELVACRAMVVVISPQWAQVSDDAGRLRLNEPDDWVRAEIELAMAQGARLVPALVGRATMPAAHELPASIRNLANLQAVELREATWDSDVDRLRAALGVAPVSRWPWVAVLAIIALLGAGAVADWMSTQSSRPAGATPGAWNDPGKVRLTSLAPDQERQEMLVKRFYARDFNVPLLRHFLSRPDLRALAPAALDGALQSHVADLQHFFSETNLYDHTDVMSGPSLGGRSCEDAQSDIKAANFDEAFAAWDRAIAKVNAAARTQPDTALYGAWCQWLAAQAEHLDGRQAEADLRLRKSIDTATGQGRAGSHSLMTYERTAARWALDQGDLASAAKATEQVAEAGRVRDGKYDPDVLVQIARLQEQLGKGDLAMSWRQRAQAGFDAKPDPGNETQRANAQALATAYQARGQADASAALRRRYGLDANNVH